MKDNNIDALKAVYVALGGSASDVANLSTNAEVIEKIAEVAGSTVELPAVSSSDNGKVLTVSGGKWQAKQPASPTSYEISVGYNVDTPSTISVSLPSGESRNSLLSGGKAIKENTYVKLSLRINDYPIQAYLPCISSSYDMGSAFEGIVAYTSDNANVFKRVVVFLSAYTNTVPDAIKIEDFSFSE